MERAPWGIDGCGIPTYAMPLESLARAFSALLMIEFYSGSKVGDEDYSGICFETTPLYCGTGRFLHRNHSGFEGQGPHKTGAEGVYCGVSFEGYAFALKARDGASRASETATAAILRYLGGLDADDFSKLSQYTQPLIRNWEGKIVGKRFVPEHHFA